jgi:hypothetical protein
MLAKQKNSYSGTSFSYDDIPKALFTFIYNILSVVPYFSWSFMVSTKFGILDFLWVVNVLVVFAIMTSSFFLYRHTKARFHRTDKQGFVGGPYLPLVATALGSVLIQSMTSKVQKETSGPHSVYIFHLNLFVCAVVLGTVFLVKIFQSEQRKKRLHLILIGMILLQTSQNGVQSFLIEGEFQSNMKIVNSLTKKIDVLERCRILEEWQARDWPQNYSQTLNLGIDYFSFKVQGEKFCSINQ